MCLAALAIDRHARFPLVVAANRDEYFDRPAEPLAWWTPAPGGPLVLSGRDLQGGGTWLGLTAAGRFALLTNVRGAGGKDDAAPSRGAIVPRWLHDDGPPERFWAAVAGAGHNPFNLIAADLPAGDWFWAASGAVAPRRLEPGLYGLSNATLDVPWPKVVALKARMAAALADADSLPALMTRLFAALGDRCLAPDAALPSTGIPLSWERQLSAAFIRTPDRRYGTRCSTLVITERTPAGHVTHVIERSFAPGDAAAAQRQEALEGWPPARQGLPADGFARAAPARGAA